MTELCSTCGQPGTELHPLRPWRWGMGHADLNACVAALRDRVEELENAQLTEPDGHDATALQDLTMDRVVALEAKLEELTENTTTRLSDHDKRIVATGQHLGELKEIVNLHAAALSERVDTLEGAPECVEYEPHDAVHRVIREKLCKVVKDVDAIMERLEAIDEAEVDQMMTAGKEITKAQTIHLK